MRTVMRKSSCSGPKAGGKGCGCGCSGASEDRVPWEGVKPPVTAMGFVDEDVLHLQRLMGNRAVQRLADPSVAQRSPLVQRVASGPPTLRQGSKGPSVVRLQQALGIAADGDFGPATAAAVRAFQGEHGLTADGVVGPQTWAAVSGGGGQAAGGPAASSGVASPEKHRLLASKLQTTTDAVQGVITASQAPPGASHLWGDDEEEAAAEPETEGSWVDDAANAASEAWDDAKEVAGDASDAASGAWDAASEAASDAWDTASDAASGAWDAATDAAGDAWDTASDAVSGAASDVWHLTGMDTVVEQVTQVVGTIRDGLNGVIDSALEGITKAVSTLEEVAGAVARGLGLSDAEIDRLLGLLAGALGSSASNLAEGEELAGAAPKADEIDVAIASGGFAVNYKGLSDLHSQVMGKMGVGHVNISSGPTMSVTSKDADGNVASVKIVCKGTANYPTAGSKTGTQSADPTREQQGITDYFSIIQGHESSHASIYTTAFTGAAAQLKGLTPTEADTKWKSIVCEAYKSQDALDTKEGCVELFGNPAKDASKVAGSNCGNTGTAAQSCP